MTFTDHTITLRDGRALAVSETGDRNGRPILFCHPAPGSRLIDPDPAATSSAGIRLIGFDRAGYGRSSALPRSTLPTIPAYADDAKEALDALGLDRVDVIGWSAGGRVALALAARHPERVRSLCVVATPAPNDEVRWMPDEYVAITKMLQRQPENAVAAMAEQLAGMAADPAAAIDAIGAGPAEKAALAADPARGERLRAMLVETFRQGAEGVAADITSYTVVPLGYSPADVRAPTSLVYSSQDVVVSPAHGEWHAEQIPGARLRVVGDGGHLVAMTEWAAILEAVG